MPTSNRTMIHKLQEAINTHGGMILYEKSQFFSKQQDRPITMYRVSQSVPTETGKYKKERLFETTSMIQIVLYLRDLWYIISNQEIPTDNEMWEDVKRTRHIDYSGIMLKEEHNGQMGNK